MRLHILIFLCAVVISCNQENNKSKNSLNGIWKSIGSGWVLQIVDSTEYTMYDVTPISCLSSRNAKLDEIITSLAIKDDTLSLFRGVLSYKFTRANTLPAFCSVPLEEKKSKDIMYNFEVFSETVKRALRFYGAQ